MKKIFLFALTILLSTSAQAQDDRYKLELQQRNSTDTSDVLRVLDNPATDGVIYFNATTKLPGYLTFGSGLSVSSGVISASSAQADWNATSGPSQVLNKPSVSTVGMTGQYADLSGAPSLATVATSGSYNDLSSKPSIPAAQIQSDWTQTSTGAADYIKNKPAARSFSYPTRSLNTCFQVSSSRDSFVAYSVDISTTSTLASGQTGTVYLEAFTDSGCTTGTQEIQRFVNGNTQSLGLSVTMVQNVTGTLTGMVPAGLYVKLRTQNNTGTPTFTAQKAQEVLL